MMKRVKGQFEYVLILNTCYLLIKKSVLLTLTYLFPKYSG